MDSLIIFEGPSPFHLPPAQRATAVGNPNDGITMTLYCQLPRRVTDAAVDHGTEPEPISVQMTGHIARELASRLLRAAADCETPLSGLST
jgi:hypothetical protein